MTFLAQSDVPGLQIRMKSDEWVEVPLIPGSFAVKLNQEIAAGDAEAVGDMGIHIINVMDSLDVTHPEG